MAFDLTPYLLLSLKGEEEYNKKSPDSGEGN
jgi:hypothetical protein